MLSKRIIPCLDVKDGVVVKGVRFRGHEIVGGVLDLAQKYRDEGADELVFYDITASSEARRVSTQWVHEIARFLDIPFCIAGGIRSRDDARALLNAGADILVHSVTDRLVDSEFISLVTKRDIPYITTLGVEDGYRMVLNQQVMLTDIEQKLGDPEVIATWSELAKIPEAEIPGGVPRVPPAPKRPAAYDNLMLLESAGARIVAGTDAGNIGTLHGPALHHELELMAAAGLRPMDIIVSATRNGAAVMGQQNDFGTLQKGKYADLVILDADPLADIKNTRKIFKVMKAGEFF